MTTPLYIGMGPPYVVRVSVAATDDFNPTQAATSASPTIEVTKPSGEDASWAATVVVDESNENIVVIEHTLAVGDLDERGTWSVHARFPLGGGLELRSVVGKLPPILNANQPSA